jgi:acyl-coenzyme A thioesterase PaaI-like protein
MSGQAAALPLIDDHYCFGCGDRNPIGLRLKFEWVGDIYRTEWIPEPEHQGWAGRVHGGLLALVLDEVLSRAALERHGLQWVTAELTTRLRRPAAVGAAYLVQGSISVVREALIICRGEVRESATGLVAATGEAKLMRV